MTTGFGAGAEPGDSSDGRTKSWLCPLLSGLRLSLSLTGVWPLVGADWVAMPLIGILDDVKPWLIALFAAAPLVGTVVVANKDGCW